MGQYCADHSAKDRVRIARAAGFAAVTAAKIAARGPCPTCSGPFPADRRVWAKHCSNACERLAKVRRGEIRVCHWCGDEFHLKANMKAGRFCGIPHRIEFGKARTQAESWVAERDAALLRTTAEASCPGAPVPMTERVCQTCGKLGAEECSRCTQWRHYIQRFGPTYPCVVCAAPVQRKPGARKGRPGAKTCTSEACVHEQRRRSAEASRDARRRSKWMRRARGVPKGFPSKVTRRRLFDRDGWKCYMCGVDVVMPGSVWDPRAGDIDHVVPIAKGGHPTDPANLRTSCKSCNSRKSDKVSA